MNIQWTITVKTGKIDMDSQAPLTEIQNFYKNKTILLTGPTEFVGKLVLEKVLRTLEVKHVYVLITGKDGKDAETRCADIFDCLAFGPLRRQDPEFYKKVTLIEGDYEALDLGLNSEIKNLLINEVECIFHCGTTTNVEQGLKETAFINVKYTRRLLEMAKGMENLMGFVFLSSAFTNFTLYEVHEQFYEPPVHYNKLIALCEGEEELIKKCEDTWLKDWPNAALYTLNVAETLLKNEGKGLPISIIRPSHILPSLNDPITGYVEDASGLTSYAVNHAMGVNRVFYYNKGTLDVVPVDYVVNMIIASGWYVGLQKIRLKRGDVTSTDIQIYHCISSQEKPITTEEFFGSIHSVFREVPTNRMIQMPFAFHTACYYNYKVLILFFHYFMGFICDTGLKIAGKQPV
ncbi:unnamed protein product [Callosobruchus maculatus]|nr:unnamed protein product [Callosobruchus maculatus]